ncbi:Cyclic pyranopterin monophosphate synthase 1 [compost metagenome]
MADLAITTNGTHLAEHAIQLHRLCVQRLNISLDSLSRERFSILTRRDKLKKVLDGIESAVAAGFKRRNRVVTVLVAQKRWRSKFED